MPNSLEKKILDRASKHPEYSLDIALSEIEQLREKKVVQDLWVICQRLDNGSVEKGTENKLGLWLAYWLGITSCKPDKEFILEKRETYGRAGFPDVDMDFDYLRRHEIVDYWIEKYGRDKVGNIGAIQTLKTKAAVRRVIKVLDPTNTVLFDKDGKVDKSSKNENFELENRILKPLPFIMKAEDGTPVTSVELACKYFPEFGRYMDAYPDIRKYASRLEGSIAAAGMHAAGVVLSPVPLSEICPLHITKDVVSLGDEDDKKQYAIATQFTMADVESLGLVKMDILGLSTKTAITWAAETVKNNHGKQIDLESLPLKDKPTIELLKSGKTDGCFQLENQGMQNTLRTIGIDNFTDLVIAVAMYRPGPKQYIKELADRKYGRMSVLYDHPLMEKITKDTYGIYCFQEQIMQAFMSLANMTATEGYVFMKGCAKKKPEIIDSSIEKFRKGAESNNIDKHIIDKVCSDFIKFAEYAFNRSHAVSYAYESWKTAYLKSHYTTEFFEARISVENIRRKFEEVQRYENDAVNNFGFTFLPSDLNESGIRYKILGDKKLRKSLLVKGVGLAAAEEIERNQPYHGDVLRSLCKKVKSISSKTIESLWEGGLLPKYKKKEEALARFAAIRKDIKLMRGQQDDDMFPD